MVNVNRTLDKIQRIEAKILSYYRAIQEGRNPQYALVLTSLNPDRLGREMNDYERRRYTQAIGDLTRDLHKNLEKLGVSWRDHVSDLAKQGLKDDILAAIALAEPAKARKSAKKPPVVKKEEKKEKEEAD